MDKQLIYYRLLSLIPHTALFLIYIVLVRLIFFNRPLIPTFLICLLLLFLITYLSSLQLQTTPPLSPPPVSQHFQYFPQLFTHISFYIFPSPFLHTLLKYENSIAPIFTVYTFLTES